MNLGISTLLLVMMVSLVGCRPDGRTDDRPLVVTSFYPLYDFARQIAGTNCEVRCLVPPGGDPHHEDPTPEMARWIEGADLVLLMGLGMDGWVEKLAKGGRQEVMVVVSEGLGTRKTGMPALAQFAEESPDPDGTDPHIWLDPVLAEKLVRRVTEELVKRVPEHAMAIRGRGEGLAAELRELHGEFERGLERVESRKVVTFHGAYAYLFERYGLETVGVIELFPGDEPSVAYLRELVDLTKRLGIRTIFAEPQLPDRPAQVIAAEIGGKVERLDPCETILVDAVEATYQERQRGNLAVLRKALGAR